MVLAALLLALACHREAGTLDDLGRHVAVPANVRRIVTIAPNVTELVAAAGAASRIVAVDDFSNFPPAVRNLPRVGGMQPSPEIIARMQPDLVLASSSGNEASLARPLGGAGIALYVVRTDRLSDVPRAIRRLGEVLHEPSAGTAAAAIERGLEASRRVRGTKPRILFVVWPGPLYVAGRGTFVDDLLRLCGAENAVPQNVTGWPEYSMEMLLKNPPDMILYPSRSVREQTLKSIFATDPSWRELAAVRSGAYYAVDEDVFTRPGPRVVDAARQLNDLLDRKAQR